MKRQRGSRQLSRKEKRGGNEVKEEGTRLKAEEHSVGGSVMEAFSHSRKGRKEVKGGD